MSARLLRVRSILPSTRAGALLCVAALALSAAVVIPSTARATNGPTVVSLTFDDATADSFQASADMVAHGMRGTYFVNSGAVGNTGSLTQSQLTQMAAAGQEIGGHTVLHQDLQGIAANEARREICNDRATLASWGLHPTSFAYPYSSVSSEVRGYVRDCGYNSARQVGSIRSPETCPDCALSESMPPADPYFSRAPDSVLSTWSLEDMKGLVTQAEDHGGGWVQLVFHHVCSGCAEYGVAPATLTALLDWLQARAAGGTVVKTVEQVIGGQYQPGVAGPAPAAPAPLGVNGVTNPGLESIASSGLPQCWQAAGSGANTASFATTTSGHAGGVAEKITVSAYTSGDRKLLPRLDLGECSPSVLAGHRYDISAWYRSSGQTGFAVYYRNLVGSWVYWTSGPDASASSGWAKASWTTPVVPVGAQALSFGLVARSMGTLTTDDYALVDVTPQADTTVPVVSLTSPAGGDIASGSVGLVASASDDVGVARVDFLVDGVVVGSSTSAPFGTNWDSATVSNGEHSLVAQAVDAAGNQGVSSPVVVSVSNAARNLVSNAGVERWTGSSPDCWQFGSSGSNVGAGTRSMSAHSGSSAVQVTVSSYSSGDRKVVTKQDAGVCAPAAVAGHHYALSAWVNSTAPTVLVAFYRDAGGVWRYWGTSPAMAATPTWSQPTWVTPALPAGATAVSFGPAITGIGTFTTDDLSLVDQG